MMLIALATEPTDYGPYAAAAALIIALFSFVSLIAGRFFAPRLLMPLYENRTAVQVLVVGLSALGLLWVLTLDKLAPVEAGAQFELFSQLIIVGLAALAVFIICAVLFVMRMTDVNGRTVPIIRGFGFKKQFREGDNFDKLLPAEYLAGALYRSVDIWRPFPRVAIVAIVVISSIVAQVSLTTGIAGVAKLLTDPVDDTVTADAAQVKVIPVQGVFAPDSDEFLPPSDAQAALDKAAITNFAPAAIYVRGHTDATVGPIDNATLSQDRAEAVKDWLTGLLGDAAPELRALGMADACPRIALDGVPSAFKGLAHANNRRVELLLIKNAEEADARAADCEADPSS